ncbi:MAG: protoheme IX farnesyltransferase [Pseudomonadota bacterium]
MAEDDQDKGFEAGEGTPTGDLVPLTDAEVEARSKRNMFIALGVTGFVIVVFLTTVLRLVQNIEAGR